MNEEFKKLVGLNNSWGMSPGHYAFVADYIRNKSENPSILVFGAGHDSAFWASLAHEILIVENQIEWIKFPSVPYLIVQYKTQRGKPSDCPVSIELPHYNWGAVIVDGPAGWNDKTPGREQSIFTAACIRRFHRGIVFVHDYERQWEKYHCDRFLGTPNEITGDEQGRLLAMWR